MDILHRDTTPLLVSYQTSPPLTDHPFYHLLPKLGVADVASLSVAGDVQARMVKVRAVTQAIGRMEWLILLCWWSPGLLWANCLYLLQLCVTVDCILVTGTLILVISWHLLACVDKSSLVHQAFNEAVTTRWSCQWCSYISYIPCCVVQPCYQSQNCQEYQSTPLTM